MIAAAEQVAAELERGGAGRGPTSSSPRRAGRRLSEEAPAGPGRGCRAGHSRPRHAGDDGSSRSLGRRKSANAARASPRLQPRAARLAHEPQAIATSATEVSPDHRGSRARAMREPEPRPRPLLRPESPAPAARWLPPDGVRAARPEPAWRRRRWQLEGSSREDVERHPRPAARASIQPACSTTSSPAWRASTARFHLSRRLTSAHRGDDAPSDRESDLHPVRRSDTAEALHAGQDPRGCVDSRVFGDIAASVLAVAAFAATAANDDFANAEAISGPLPIVVTATVDEATREPGEPYFGDSTVWYRWTATENREVAIESCGGESYPPLVHVYTGSSLASLNKVRSRDEQDNRAKCPLPNPATRRPDRHLRGGRVQRGCRHDLPHPGDSQLVRQDGHRVEAPGGLRRRAEPIGFAPDRSPRRIAEGGPEGDEPGQHRRPGTKRRHGWRSGRRSTGRAWRRTWARRSTRRSGPPAGTAATGSTATAASCRSPDCRVTPLAPGESQLAQIRIKRIKGNLLLDAHIFINYERGGDARKGNNDAQTVIRVRG